MITNHFLLDLKIVNTYILLSIRILQGSLTTEVNFQRYSRSYILRSSISYLVRQRRKMKDISPTFIFLVNFLMLVDIFCVYLITKFLRDHSFKTSACLRGHSQTTFTRFGFFGPLTLLRLHFLWYKSLQKVDFFDHLPRFSCKRSL